MACNGGRINDEQKTILLQFMEANPDLVIGKLTRSFTQSEKNRLWSEITDLLNSCGLGAQKNAENWRGCWGDIKSNVKKKLSKLKTSIEKTGGGFASENPINLFEERVAALMGVSTVFGTAGPPMVGKEAFQKLLPASRNESTLPPVRVTVDQDGCFHLPDNLDYPQEFVVTTSPRPSVNTGDDYSSGQDNSLPAHANTPATEHSNGKLTSKSSGMLINIPATGQPKGRRRNLKRSLSRMQELEHASKYVGGFASAQERQVEVLKDIGHSVRELLDNQKRAQQQERDDEIISLRRRSVAAQELQAAAEMKKAEALQRLADHFCK